MSIFTSVQAKKPTSSTFDLSHTNKLTANMGIIYPALLMDMLPGDKFNINTSCLIRMAPMVAPVMHQLTAYMHYFFVPNRIVWDEFEQFISPEKEDLSPPVWPTFTEAVVKNTLGDYMGLAIDNVPYEYSAIPFAGYNKIFNEYYRDENLITKIVDSCSSGANSFPQLLKRKAWQHDYLTSALPWTQKGSSATIPLGAVEPVYLDTARFIDADGTSIAAGSENTIEMKGDGSSEARVGSSHDGSWHEGSIRNLKTMEVTATTINDLRSAFALQRFLETNARGGSRYIETIYAHFDVKSLDARLQRPELLGGGKVKITFSEVLQTAPPNGETPLGTMAGHGIGAGLQGSCNFRATEFGYIFGMLSVVPKTGYFQGVPKHFKKFDKLDFGWPSFANLGEQPIYNYEVYQDESDADNADVFGYTPRFAEYKYVNNRLCGEFRDTLAFWTIARKFENRPLLNEQFIECLPPTDMFANEQGEQLYIMLVHNVRAKRKLPFYGTPKP